MNLGVCTLQVKFLFCYAEKHILVRKYDSVYVHTCIIIDVYLLKEGTFIKNNCLTLPFNCIRLVHMLFF